MWGGGRKQMSASRVGEGKGSRGPRECKKYSTSQSNRVYAAGAEQGEGRGGEGGAYEDSVHGRAGVPLAEEAHKCWRETLTRGRGEGGEFF